MFLVIHMDFSASDRGCVHWLGDQMSVSYRGHLPTGDACVCQRACTFGRSMVVQQKHVCYLCSLLDRPIELCDK